MDRGSRYPTHVVVRQRLTQQLATWNAEHTRFHAEQLWSLDQWKLPRLMMTYSDAPGLGVYSAYVITDALITHLLGASVEGALHTINMILLGMQRQIGEVRSGTYPAT